MSISADFERRIELDIAAGNFGKAAIELAKKRDLITSIDIHQLPNSEESPEPETVKHAVGTEKELGRTNTWSGLFSEQPESREKLDFTVMDPRLKLSAKLNILGIRVHNAVRKISGIGKK